MIPRSNRNYGFLNFDAVKHFVHKFLGEKLLKDTMANGRDKLVKLGILKNPAVFGSTIPDIIKLEGSKEKIPEFLKISVRTN